MNDTPPSSSSWADFASSGMNIEVSTEPSTSSVIMLGSVLAVLNAEATAGPSTVRMRIIRMKPVMRLARLATAIEPVDRMREASDESRVRPPIPPPGGSVASDPGPPRWTEGSRGAETASGGNESAIGGGANGWAGSVLLPASRRRFRRPGSGLRRPESSTP